MRKSIYFSAALAALFATSCSSDMVQPANGDGEGNVVLKLQLPKELATRAVFGDGTTATRLQYAVYHNGDKTPIITDEATFVDLQATVALQLVNGQKYDFVFWADSSTKEQDATPESKYYVFDAASQEVTVNYDNLNGNDEGRDAFFGQLTDVEITGPTTLSATLKRPFAQINLGTSDFSNTAVKAVYGENCETLTSSMEVTTTGLPTTLNLLDGKVDGATTQSVTFAAVGRPDASFGNYPVEDYEYVSMNYILVGTDKEVLDLSYTFNNGTTEMANLPLAAVPVQRNYRTNIYGAVLTSPTDLTITIAPAFEEPDYGYEVTIVKSVDEFVSAVEKGGSIEIPKNIELDLRTVNDGGEIILAPNTFLKINGTVNTARAQLSVTSGTVTVDGEGVGKITSVGFPTGSRPLNVYDGATLIVKNIEVETEQNNGGSAIYSVDGNLELENVTVNCHHFAIGANGGTLKAKNCVFNSDSNNKVGDYSYTVDVAAGCKAVFDECEVNGVQGGISVGNKDSVVTINSGTYTTRNLEEYKAQTAFYPVYIFDEGLAIINGGDFISGCEYTIFNGNNDVPEFYTWGNGACLQGGRYNKGTINQASQLTYPAAEGYEWVAIEGDDVFKFEVVKKGE
ncbi:MAG: hypothetical protein K2J82_09515 [Muribaculaceae bacterium]|nr:hypothetical protein [Muribaculaceae bacterium]MDE6754831.1 hypothetical protein [Muribaculaceae bacterium]